MFWISTLLLLLTGIAFVLVPVFLMRNTAESENGQRVAANIALYRERSRELIDELNSGALDRAGYDSLLAELQRSLLSDTGPGEAGGANVSRGMSGSEGPAMPLSKQVRNLLTAGPSAARPGTGLLQPVKLIPLIAVLLIPPVAYGLYEKWGYHDDIQLSGLFRQALHPSNDPKEVSALIMALKSAVQEYPDNQWAWYFLGRSYSRLGMHKLASDAYLSALSYLDNEPDRVMAMSQYVLAEFQGADRQLTESARNMAARVLAINPDEQTVLRVLATEARERDDLATAIEYWRRLVRASPASSAARVYRSNIAAAENMLRDRGELPLDNRAALSTSSPRVEVTIALAPGLDLPPDLAVFVAARNAEKEGMPPLAVVRLVTGQLPATVVLDNSSAVGPFNLGSAESVTVSALVSRRGVANPQTGDYRTMSGPLNPRSSDTESVSLVIAEQVD